MLLICILFLSACVGLDQGKSEQAANPINSGRDNKDYSKIISKTHATGSVRVIVSLNMTFVPEGQLSAREAVDQQAQISKMQDQLCEALSKYKVKEIRRYKHTPYIAMEVDSAALRALISDPLVIRLEEDLPAPPH